MTRNLKIKRYIAFVVNYRNVHMEWNLDFALTWQKYEENSKKKKKGRKIKSNLLVIIWKYKQ